MCFYPDKRRLNPNFQLFLQTRNKLTSVLISIDATAAGTTSLILPLVWGEDRARAYTPSREQLASANPVKEYQISPAGTQQIRDQWNKLLDRQAG